MTEELKVSSPQDFKKVSEERELGRLLRLPSGLVLRVKVPQLARLLRENLVPTNLINALLKQSRGEGANDKEDAIKTMEAQDKVFELSIIEPKFSIKPVENEIGPNDLSDMDRGTLWAFILKGGIESDDLNSFRN